MISFVHEQNSINAFTSDCCQVVAKCYTTLMWHGHAQVHALRNVSQLEIFYHKNAGYRLRLPVNLCEAPTRQRPAGNIYQEPTSSAKNSQNVTNRPRSHDATVASSVSYTVLIEQKLQNARRQVNLTSDRAKEGSSSRKKGWTRRNRGG